MGACETGRPAWRRTESWHLTDSRDIDEVEEDLRQRAAEDLPALELASKAGDRLALIIGGTPVTPTAGDQSARERQLG